ncbi:MAG: hypothetical protein LUC34_03900 [Campylobacter sp.]|nr:hypothetical protein [Campylobacter sp.]
MPSYDELKKEWNEKGESYAKAINEMVAWSEENGWDNFKGKEPQDGRDEKLCGEVYKLLAKANESGDTAKFRADFPPSNIVINDELDKLLCNIDQIFCIDYDNAVFVASKYSDGRTRKTTYMLHGNEPRLVATDIIAVGKSKQNEIFAVARNGEITLTKGFALDGEILARFRHDIKDDNIIEILPFNDGSKVVVVSYGGIFLIGQEGAKLIHAEIDEYNDDENYEIYIDMANATLSNDNKFIVTGDQCSDHILLDANGEKLGVIGVQSSYSHFCLFAKDDSQLITNSCHFYNGITIGIDGAQLKKGLEVEAYSYDDEHKNFIVIDDAMRVYAGVVMSEFYVLGDAYGYIKAISKDGTHIWRYYLGGTIRSMAVTDDGKTLFVGTYGGRLHKLKFGEPRHSHAIGTADIGEEFRLLVFEDKIYKW